MQGLFRPDEEHKELDKVTYENLVYYLYYLLFFNQWLDKDG